MEHQKDDGHTSAHNQEAAAIAKLPETFTVSLTACQTALEKIEYMVDFMQHIVDEGDGRQFGHFWAVQALCLKEFMQTLPAVPRACLWSRYSSLCQEARALKERFHKKSAFVTEQIYQAIQAIDIEYAAIEQEIAIVETIPTVQTCYVTKAHALEYQALQTEINFLSLLVLKIVALRKDLVNTDMRVKDRKSLFQFLQKVDAKISPRKKSAVQRISAIFYADVEEFVNASPGRSLHALYRAKDAVKQLQRISKTLTLTSDGFKNIRSLLSIYWESLQQAIDAYQPNRQPSQTQV